MGCLADARWLSKQCAPVKYLSSALIHTLESVISCLKRFDFSEFYPLSLGWVSPLQSSQKSAYCCSPPFPWKQVSDVKYYKKYFSEILQKKFQVWMSKRHKLSLSNPMHIVDLNADLGLRNELAKLISFWEVILFYDFMVSLASSFRKPKSSFKPIVF